MRVGKAIVALTFEAVEAMLHSNRARLHGNRARRNTHSCWDWRQRPDGSYQACMGRCVCGLFLAAGSTRLLRRFAGGCLQDDVLLHPRFTAPFCARMQSQDCSR